MKQHEAVIEALEKLNGIATLNQINIETMKISDCNWGTKTPFASIRRIVQTRKEIYKIKPGLYGLVKFRKNLESKGIYEENEGKQDSEKVQEFTHSYYQGIILTMGKMKGYNTFAPNQDKNKLFIETPIGELRTLNDIPSFSYKRITDKSSTIDVIWFNKREMPNSFFEIEHSTDIQNSLIKFSELQDFFVRFLIVADKRRRNEYETKLSNSVFKEIKPRVNFLEYESLIKQYERLLELETVEVVL